MNKSTIEKLLTENYGALERYVKFRISNPAAASDIVQEVCVSVLSHYKTLRSADSFRPWLYRIARNKLNDFYRVPPREIQTDKIDKLGRCPNGEIRHNAVSETLAKLRKSDKELLVMCYMSDRTQKEAAEKLGISLNTLKSRLTAARNNFRKNYPYTKEMERFEMKKVKFPEYMPEYTITQSSAVPFEVIHEAIIGWGIIPKLGEKCAWASYDFPERKITETMQLEVTGRAEVHGIEGVEIKAVESGCAASDNLVFAAEKTERWFIAQLTETHSRILAESHIENGIKKCYTFLDGAPFLDNWGYGEDNCGIETHLKPRGNIIKSGGTITITADRENIIDVCGRFDVTILGKTHDTICLMDIETYDTKVMTETYIDQSGKIILWRRFNRNDWGKKRIGQLWTERFPANETVVINNETYVHWYDCIYDYML